MEIKELYEICFNENIIFNSLKEIKQFRDNYKFKIEEGKILDWVQMLTDVNDTSIILFSINQSKYKMNFETEI